MSFTEHFGGFKAEASPPVRRCKWCIARTGAATYFEDGDWIHEPNPIHYFGTAEFTDGICPDCLAGEMAKIKRLNQK